MKIWVLLPAFNEADALPILLPKISSVFTGDGYSHRIVVVNDGSVDGTEDVLNDHSLRLPLDIVTHRINRGLGETERDGFEYISANCADDDIVIRMDCDDTHEPEYSKRMIDRILEGYDVVSASRFQPGGGQLGVNRYRAFISYGANIFMKIMFNIEGIKDYSCGFRAYRGKAIKYAVKIFGNGFIQLKGLGFTSTLETIVKLKMLGCRFSEVPFILRYDQKAGYSKMISSVTTLGYFAMAVLYHWPFGGWKSFYKGLDEMFRNSPESALENFGCYSKKRTAVCRIGGG
ncbi:MAG: glycosyltransferase [Nitrospirae bacterium]|nr:MAG: glycosyltransferase [Nitrospirota bacterium]